MAYVKVNHDPKECAQCGGEFKPKTSHQNFCGKSCYRTYGKKHLGHSSGDEEKQKERQRVYLRKKRRPYIDNRKGFCERCNFVAEHPCQLDVDHIDGDHSNNSIDNLQTLCANCHRLKTAKQLGWRQYEPPKAL